MEVVRYRVRFWKVDFQLFTSSRIEGSLDFDLPEVPVCGDGMLVAIPAKQAVVKLLQCKLLIVFAYAAVC